MADHSVEMIVRTVTVLESADQQSFRVQPQVPEPLVGPAVCFLGEVAAPDAAALAGQVSQVAAVAKADLQRPAWPAGG